MKKILKPWSLVLCLTMCCILWTIFHIKRGKLPLACFIISICLLTLFLAIFDDTFLTKYFEILETFRHLRNFGLLSGDNMADSDVVVSNVSQFRFVVIAT